MSLAQELKAGFKVFYNHYSSGAPRGKRGLVLEVYQNDRMREGGTNVPVKLDTGDVMTLDDYVQVVEPHSGRMQQLSQFDRVVSRVAGQDFAEKLKMKLEQERNALAKKNKLGAAILQQGQTKKTSSSQLSGVSSTSRSTTADYHSDADDFEAPKAVSCGGEAPRGARAAATMARAMITASQSSKPKAASAKRRRHEQAAVDDSADEHTEEISEQGADSCSLVHFLNRKNQEEGAAASDSEGGTSGSKQAARIVQAKRTFEVKEARLKEYLDVSDPLLAETPAVPAPMISASFIASLARPSALVCETTCRPPEAAKTRPKRDCLLDEDAYRSSLFSGLSAQVPVEHEFSTAAANRGLESPEKATASPRPKRRTAAAAELSDVAPITRRDPKPRSSARTDSKKSSSLLSPPPSSANLSCSLRSSCPKTKKA